MEQFLFKIVIVFICSVGVLIRSRPHILLIFLSDFLKYTSFKELTCDARPSLDFQESRVEKGKINSAHEHRSNSWDGTCSIAGLEFDSVQ